MTQKYYVERLLLVYIDAIEKARQKIPGNWLLQEDGDPSHGTKKPGLAQALKDKHKVKRIIHPA
ncbi:hypothetical protein BJ875DRAFT_395659 [Amylocarpus encephaloides]|uniref:Uncharacterized protein n=1 Tax=Amylocarpus encephaloides TaxID=45428 RepID=A0A9P7YNQ8_9HELO|nr:hypothetical protein BJ875DRAFT_395659 [Amylocarpus encephaloides]